MHTNNEVDKINRRVRLRVLNSLNHVGFTFEVIDTSAKITDITFAE